MSPYDDGWLLDVPFKWQPFAVKKQIANPFTGLRDGSHTMTYYDADGNCTASGVAVPYKRKQKE